MKYILLTGLLVLSAGQMTVDAQSRKSVKDDIYYTAEDAQKDADAAEQERIAREEARRKRAAEESANSYNSTDGNDYYGGDNGGEYIDYDDDDYTYANRFNRFNGPYYGGSYWAYDPFWGNPWYGGGYWNRGWGMGMGVGFGGPYWSSYWGWNSWYGYPGFYSVWNSPYCMGWGYGNWGYGGGYYAGYYDGFYSGAYAGNGFAGNGRTYGPRSSINRYPGSARSTGSRTGNTIPGQLRRSSTAGELRQAPSSNRNYSGRYIPPAENRSGNAVERSAPSRGGVTERTYNNGSNSTAAPSNSREYRSRPTRQYNNQNTGSYSNGNSTQQQRSEPSYSQPQRSQPSRSYSQPSQQRSTPSYSSPSRSSGGGSFGGGRSGGGFSGGSRGGGGRR